MKNVNIQNLSVSGVFKIPNDNMHGHKGTTSIRYNTHEDKVEFFVNNRWTGINVTALNEQISALWAEQVVC